MITRLVLLLSLTLAAVPTPTILAGETWADAFRPKPTETAPTLSGERVKPKIGVRESTERIGIEEWSEQEPARNRYKIDSAERSTPRSGPGSGKPQTAGRSDLIAIPVQPQKPAVRAGVHWQAEPPPAGATILRNGYEIPPDQRTPPAAGYRIPVTPNVAGRGVPAPTFPGRAGLQYDPDHNCDRCGSAQYVWSGSGPVPGSHTHTCSRCGHTWYHGNK